MTRTMISVDPPFYMNIRMTTAEQKDYRQHHERTGKGVLAANNYGIEAYNNNYTMGENPFHSGTIEWVEWCKGWLQEEEKRVREAPLF